MRNRIDDELAHIRKEARTTALLTVATLTMALLTVATLAMALLTMALLTVALLTVAPLTVALYSPGAPRDLRSTRAVGLRGNAQAAPAERLEPAALAGQERRRLGRAACRGRRGQGAPGRAARHRRDGALAALVTSVCSPVITPLPSSSRCVRTRSGPRAMARWEVV